MNEPPSKLYNKFGSGAVIIKLPVETVQVGWVIVTVGASGAFKTVLIVIEAALEDVQPSEFVTLKV